MRLIDADALKENYEKEIDAIDMLKEYIENGLNIKWETFSYAIGVKDSCIKSLERVDEMPTIEPGKKVGEWIHDADGLMWCDTCGFGKERSDDRLYRFCPNCGARMGENANGAEPRR